MKKRFAIPFALSAAGAAGFLAAKNSLKKTLADETKKRDLIDKGDRIFVILNSPNLKPSNGSVI